MIKKNISKEFNKVMFGETLSGDNWGASLYKDYHIGRPITIYPGMKILETYKTKKTAEKVKATLKNNGIQYVRINKTKAAGKGNKYYYTVLVGGKGSNKSSSYYENFMFLDWENFTLKI